MPIDLKGGLSIKQESLSGFGLSQTEASLGGKINPGTGGTGGAKWGKIKGNIEDQTDLIEKFNSISINSLIQEDGSFFILDCGSSTEVIGE